MNGYKMQADSYRAFLEREPNEENKADLEAQIRIFDFLASCTDADIHRLFNSSAFNSILKGYVAIAADELEGLTDEQRSNLKGKMAALLDRYTAGEAEAYYYNH